MTNQFDQTIIRRRHFRVTDNPRQALDYLVSLSGVVTAPDPGSAIDVRVRYVPNRVILPPSNFRSYLALLAETTWPSAEDLGQTLLGDLNSEIDPRWVQVMLTAAVDDIRHDLLFEDRAPKWDNPRLLARIAPSI